MKKNIRSVILLTVLLLSLPVLLYSNQHQLSAAFNHTMISRSAPVIGMNHAAQQLDLPDFEKAETIFRNSSVVNDGINVPVLKSQNLFLSGLCFLFFYALLLFLFGGDWGRPYVFLRNCFQLMERYMLMIRTGHQKDGKKRNPLLN